MDKQNLEYLNNVLKGTIAERVFETMMTNYGFNVFRFGYEHRTPNLAHEIRSSDSNRQIYQPKETINNIQSTPDFIITTDKKKSEDNIFLVEVKFRSALKYENDDHSLFDTANNIYHYYKKAHLFVISLDPVGIYFDSAQDIINTNSNNISPIHENELMKAHGVTQESINAYMEVVKQFVCSNNT